MDEKNLKIIRCIAGAMFFVLFIMILLELTGNMRYAYHSYYGDYGVVMSQFTWIYSKPALILEMLAVLVLAVGMFAGIYTLLPVGAGIYCLAYIVDTIAYISDYGSIIELFVLLNLFALAGYAFFALSVSQREVSIRYGLVSIIILFVSRLIFYYLVYDYVYPNLFDFVFANLYQTAVAAVSIFLTNIVLQNAPRGHSSKTMKQIGKPAKADRIEELTKLKDLLDVGAITQEEFDAKKKQLLNL